jgi:hypothetical protein
LQATIVRQIKPTRSAGAAVETRAITIHGSTSSGSIRPDSAPET